MPLPASGPISMSMVATEFSVSLTDISLSNLGTKLNNSITAGDPVELASDFYGQSALKPFAYSGTTPYEDASSACSEGGSGSTGYHDGSGTFPAAGDNVFSDSAGSSPLSDGFYRISSGQSMNVESGTVNGAPSNCGR